MSTFLTSKILPSFTHPHIILNAFFFASDINKRAYGVQHHVAHRKITMCHHFAKHFYILYSSTCLHSILSSLALTMSLHSLSLISYPPPPFSLVLDVPRQITCKCMTGGQGSPLSAEAQSQETPLFSYIRGKSLCWKLWPVKSCKWCALIFPDSLDVLNALLFQQVRSY